MTDYRVDLGALENLIGRVTEVECRVESLATDMDAQIRRLHGDWTGRAAEEHRAAHRQWSAGADRMRAALADLRTVLSTAHENYSAAVEANVRMWV